MERKRKGFSLGKKPNDYYLHLLENSKDVFYLMNARSRRFEYISKAVTNISGFVPEEIIEMGMDRVRDRFHPDELKNVKGLTFDILDDKKKPEESDTYTELRFKHKGGHWVWLGISRNFIKSVNGEIEAVVGNIRDITEFKILHKKLETSLNNYKSLYHNARVALYRTRINDGKLIECNDTLSKFLGYSNFHECMTRYDYVNHYVDIERRNELLAILKEKGQIQDFEIKLRKVNGEIFWIKTSARIHPEEGYIEGAIWDITATKILTAIEKSILDLILQGKSNKEIANQLFRSVRTIEDHRAHIMQKLGVTNVVELTKKAIESGISNS
ncbi:MAG: PAS domain S-box protein [Phycisphaerales bacterium]